MAMVSVGEQDSISWGGNLVVGLVSCAFGEDDRVIVSQGAGGDVGCMDSAPIAVDKLRYQKIGAMQHTDPVGWGRLVGC